MSESAEEVFNDDLGSLHSSGNIFRVAGSPGTGDEVRVPGRLHRQAFVVEALIHPHGLEESILSPAELTNEDLSTISGPRSIPSHPGFTYPVPPMDLEGSIRSRIGSEKVVSGSIRSLLPVSRQQVYSTNDDERYNSIQSRDDSEQGVSGSIRSLNQYNYFTAGSDANVAEEEEATGFNSVKLRRSGLRLGSNGSVYSTHSGSALSTGPHAIRLFAESTGTMRENRYDPIPKYPLLESAEEVVESNSVPLYSSAPLHADNLNIESDRGSRISETRSEVARSTDNFDSSGTINSAVLAESVARLKKKMNDASVIPPPPSFHVSPDELQSPTYGTAAAEVYPEESEEYPAAPGEYQDEPVADYIEEEPTGYPEEPVGYPEEPVGYPEEPVGYEEEPVGYPEEEHLGEDLRSVRSGVEVRNSMGETTEEHSAKELDESSYLNANQVLDSFPNEAERDYDTAASVLAGSITQHSPSLRGSCLNIPPMPSFIPPTSSFHPLLLLRLFHPIRHSFSSRHL